MPAGHPPAGGAGYPDLGTIDTSLVSAAFILIGSDRPRAAGGVTGSAKAKRWATSIDPGLFMAKPFRLGISGQLLQQVAVGGLMIVLPLYLQRCWSTLPQPFGQVGQVAHSSGRMVPC